MEHKDFDTLLQDAINGNLDDIEKLLQMYSPLIDANSFIRGKLDEDLRQYILIHIVKNLSKFKI